MNHNGNIRKVRFMITILVALLLGSSTLVQASSKTDAMKAYKDQMQKTSESYKFALIYLDKDAIPELVINDGRLYTYKKGSGISPLHEDYEYDYKKYYKKKGVIFSEINMGAMMGYDSGYYSRVSGGKLVTLGHFNHYNNGTTRYFNGDYKFKEISKSAFEASVKKYVQTKKPTRIKYYKNTAANRNKILK